MAIVPFLIWGDRDVAGGKLPEEPIESTLESTLGFEHEIPFMLKAKRSGRKM